MTCSRCQASLLGVAVQTDALRHQITELPPMQVRITEHCLHRCVCPGCGQINLASLPQDISRSHFGPRFTAIVALLSGRFRISRRELASLSSQWFATPLSIATVQALCDRAAAALLPAYEQIADIVRQQRRRNRLAQSWQAHLAVGRTHPSSLFRIQPQPLRRTHAQRRHHRPPAGYPTAGLPLQRLPRSATAKTTSGFVRKISWSGLTPENGYIYLDKNGYPFDARKVLLDGFRQGASRQVAKPSREPA